MTATASRRPPTPVRRERGFVMVTGMLFLVIMTLLGLALFRSTGLMDRITANTRDKQRSFEAAQAAMEYGAWWLTTSAGGGAPSTCASNSNATVAAIHVCTEALSTSFQTVAALGWAPQAFTYTPQNMAIATGGGVNTSGTTGSTDVNYIAPPGVYVERLGLSSDGTSMYYQLTSYGYGGDGNTASALRATFKQIAKTTNLKNP
jgi:type IV pilus assembly protein PilX